MQVLLSTKSWNCFFSSAENQHFLEEEQQSEYFTSVGAQLDDDHGEDAIEPDHDQETEQDLKPVGAALLVLPLLLLRRLFLVGAIAVAALFTVASLTTLPSSSVFATAIVIPISSGWTPAVARHVAHVANVRDACDREHAAAAGLAIVRGVDGLDVAELAALSTPGPARLSLSIRFGVGEVRRLPARGHLDPD